MMFLAALCFLWAGMVLGISFLETPIKFTVPRVTLPIGLDIGRHVFGVFNKVEIGMVLLAFGLIVMSRAGRAVWMPLLVTAIIVVLQSVWLLPFLDARVTLILEGQTPPPTPHHIVYIVFDLIKLLSLIGAGIAALRALRRWTPPNDLSPSGA